MIIAIAGVTNNRAIGKNGQLAARNKADMDFFVDATMGHPCILGRKTYESIPEKFRPFKGRTSIIITSNNDYKLPVINQDDKSTNVLKCTDIGKAVHLAEQCLGNDKIFLCGGESIYKWAIEHADQLWITEIPVEVEGADRFFPEIDPSIWKEISREPSADNSCVFVKYARI